MLDDETSFQYLDQPLRDVIDDIAFRHGIPIVIDVMALEDYGIGTDTPMSITLKGISLKSALRLMLNNLDLNYVIQHEVMQITTSEQAKKRRQIHVYRVDDLVGDGKSIETLLILLERMSEEDGTEIALFGQRVVVKASFSEHERIMRLLRALAQNTSVSPF